MWDGTVYISESIVLGARCMARRADCIIQDSPFHAIIDDLPRESHLSGTYALHIRLHGGGCVVHGLAHDVDSMIFLPTIIERFNTDVVLYCVHL